jgi:hypothetical protein
MAEPCDAEGSLGDGAIRAWNHRVCQDFFYWVCQGEFANARLSSWPIDSAVNLPQRFCDQ